MARPRVQAFVYRFTDTECVVTRRYEEEFIDRGCLFSAVISHPVDDVWDVVRRFGELDKALPSVQKLELVPPDGDQFQIGIKRILHFPDNKLLETLVELSDSNHVLVLSIDGTDIVATTQCWGITTAKQTYISIKCEGVPSENIEHFKTVLGTLVEGYKRILDAPDHGCIHSAVLRHPVDKVWDLVRRYGEVDRILTNIKRVDLIPEGGDQFQVGIKRVLHFPDSVLTETLISLSDSDLEMAFAINGTEIEVTTQCWDVTTSGDTFLLIRAEGVPDSNVETVRGVLKNLSSGYNRVLSAELKYDEKEAEPPVVVEEGSVTVQYSEILPHSIEKTWDRVRRFGEVDAIFPVQCSLLPKDSDQFQVGVKRVIDGIPRGKITETLTELSDSQHVLSLDIDGTEMSATYQCWMETSSNSTLFQLTVFGVPASEESEVTNVVKDIARGFNRVLGEDQEEEKRAPVDTPDCQYSTVITHSVDKVWDLVRRFGEVDQILPQIKNLKLIPLDGDQMEIGIKRILTFESSFLSETLLSISDTERSLTLAIDGADIEVTTQCRPILSSDTTFISFTTEGVPEEKGDGTRGVLRQLAEGYQRKLGGTPVDVDRGCMYSGVIKHPIDKVWGVVRRYGEVDKILTNMQKLELIPADGDQFQIGVKRVLYFPDRQLIETLTSLSDTDYILSLDIDGTGISATTQCWEITTSNATMIQIVAEGVPPENCENVKAILKQLAEGYARVLN